MSVFKLTLVGFVCKLGLNDKRKRHKNTLMHIAHYIVSTGGKLLQFYSAAFLCLSASALALKIAEDAKGKALPLSDQPLKMSDMKPETINKNNS